MYSYLYKEKTKFRIWQRSFEMLYVSQLHFSNASEKEDKMSSKAPRFHNMNERMKAFVTCPKKFLLKALITNIQSKTIL